MIEFQLLTFAFVSQKKKTHSLLIITFYHKIKIFIVYCIDITLRYFIGRQKTCPTSLQSNPIIYCKIYKNFRVLIITFYHQIKISIVYCIDLRYLIG